MQCIDCLQVAWPKQRPKSRQAAKSSEQLFHCSTGPCHAARKVPNLGQPSAFYTLKAVRNVVIQLQLPGLGCIRARTTGPGVILMVLQGFALAIFA